MDTAAVCSEIEKTWNREDVQQWAEAYGAVFPRNRGIPLSPPIFANETLALWRDT